MIEKDYISLDEKFKIPSISEINNLMLADGSSDVEDTGSFSKPAGKPVEDISAKKECFGLKFNPLNPKCNECNLVSNCKTLTIQLLTTPNGAK